LNTIIIGVTEMLSVYILYLFYGLSFFVLGITIFTKDVHFSHLEVAKIIRLLGIFGFIHGIHEWAELYSIITKYYGSPVTGEQWHLLRVVIIGSSFYFLLLFGIQINRIVFPALCKRLESKTATISIFVMTTTFSLFIIAMEYRIGDHYLVRGFLGFPAAFISGIGLIFYARSIRELSTEGAWNFKAAGFTMLFYSIFTGIIPSSTFIPLASINVVALRGISAIGIMVFIMRALRTFDIEHLKIIEKKMNLLAESEKLTSIGKLAAGIAHEINNPLTNASLTIEMLKDRMPEDPIVQKKLAAVEKNVDRASKIAKELLLFYRKDQLVFEIFHLRRLMESTKGLLLHHPSFRNLEVEIREDPLIRGIFWKLEEVMINLIINAFDASTANDRVRIVCTREQETAVIRIMDTGHGIPQALLHKVFDPFFTTKEAGQGTGMGLYVCYNIVKFHDGVITIDSTSPQGTTVTIKLPINISDE
jgi:two-component system, NtrC family, sensor kinase